ncbi:ComF family protein [Campylobacter sp. TTU-622]|uniref:ComF family protein n=1 Tax=unclassified Campylobacter TaxID=2593542 RepID=UPI0019081954|nr:MULTISPECIES: phosphoribosyltransferase family protein [unclassified Campylobacter]MBK1973796.1 ComF family protein [Campylobacter sp. TTU-622]MBK1991344.1 ComF family protein [Campylobacter sp. 2018MI34]
MKCFNCEEFALLGFCDKCKENLKELSLSIRMLDKNFKVYSFYKYEQIKHLLYSKHHFYGYFVFNMLAKLSFKKFKHFFNPDIKINAIALDDKVENLLYSHSAILLRYLKSKNIKPVYGALHAQSNVKYSGQNMQFRQQNKRNYKLLKKINHPVILVDDVVTSGSSLLEAKELLEKNKIFVLFALVLADAKE